MSASSLEVDLDRQGPHPGLGEMHLAQLLATRVGHGLDHIIQISRTMAKAYRMEAGAWSAFLSGLRDRE